SELCAKQQLIYQISEKNTEMTKRKSGILLHVTSLPGKDGTGTLGKNSYQFVDFLVKAKQKLWQILPLGQVGYGDSPYQCYSAYAGNVQLIDLELLTENGWLKETEIKPPAFSKEKAEFEKAREWKKPLLEKAYKNFQKNTKPNIEEYLYFQYEHDWWLNDFALFMALKDFFKGETWNKWPNEIKCREPEAIKVYQKKLQKEIDLWKFLQWQFFRQWHELKKYANSKGIEIIGDVPLYVSTDSSDVWTNTDIFHLDKNLDPTEVGGVPPDYFSKTGQLWGNPVFNWQRLEERQFDWWLSRLHFNLNMYNLVRIDHFRGLESYWSIPAGEKTAINGKWVNAKGFQLLAKFREQNGSLPFIAEDLGLITPEVEKLRDDLHLTGIKVLQFAFGSDEKNVNLPHNYKTHFLVCTGTHDNDTTLGWLTSAKGKEKRLIRRYLGDPEQALQKAIEMVWASTAKLSIVPLQDVLGLDTTARMNTPGTASGNWGWRFYWKQLNQNQIRFLKELTEKYNR
ncbi:MAG TPA: 4-alpha-glucanotransferase, partial [Draconibacterium sp.]|nr:4-alpha-glucanotransferase [Draconibacterium sp.]